MPIYEYACAKCESEFEVEQRITEDPIKTCPKCRSRKVKRLISRTSFVLKGGGWYSDLYSSNNNANDKTEGKGESGGESSTADSKESKSSESGDKKSKDKKVSKKGDKKKSPKAAA
jgi:putative FmdB family regulatory protein